MCGRYMLTSPVEALRQLFLFEQRPNLMPRYNIAPTQDVPIVRLTRDGAVARELIMARWGLVPFWADDLKIGNRLINARRETVHTMRPFREAYSRRRCLVPADGFFEWQQGGQGAPAVPDPAQGPGAVRLRGPVGALAAIPADGTVVRSCTIITCPANELVAPIHDRMPVILAPEDHARWLDPAATDARRPARAVPGGVARKLSGQPAGQQPEARRPGLHSTCRRARARWHCNRCASGALLTTPRQCSCHQDITNATRILAEGTMEGTSVGCDRSDRTPCDDHGDRKRRDSDRSGRGNRAEAFRPAGSARDRSSRARRSATNRPGAA